MEQFEFISLELLVVHQDSLRAIVGTDLDIVAQDGHQNGLINCYLLKTRLKTLKMTSHNRRMQMRLFVQKRLISVHSKLIVITHLMQATSKKLLMQKEDLKQLQVFRLEQGRSYLPIDYTGMLGTSILKAGGM